MNTFKFYLLLYVASLFEEVNDIPEKDIIFLTTSDEAGQFKQQLESQLGIKLNDNTLLKCRYYKASGKNKNMFLQYKEDKIIIFNYSPLPVKEQHLNRFVKLSLYE